MRPSRVRRRVDANQQRIVAALRAHGCLVQSLAAVGEGCPDLLVGCPDDVLRLMEVKDESQPPNKRALTPAEAEWHRAWAYFPIYIVETVAEALKAARC